MSGAWEGAFVLMLRKIHLGAFVLKLKKIHPKLIMNSNEDNQPCHSWAGTSRCPPARPGSASSRSDSGCEQFPSWPRSVKEQYFEEKRVEVEYDLYRRYKILA